METIIPGWYVMVQTGSVLLLIGIRWRTSVWQRQRLPTGTTSEPQRV